MERVKGRVETKMKRSNERAEDGKRVAAGEKEEEKEQESHSRVTPDLDIEKLFNITLATIS